MAIRNTFSRDEAGLPQWVESMGNPDGIGGLEVRNTLRVHDEQDSVSFGVTSKVVGSWAPESTTKVAARITYSDAERLRDHLNEILARHGR